MSTTASATASTAATATAPSPRTALDRRARQSKIIRDYGILFVIVALVLALSIGTDTFLTLGNLQNLLDQISVVGILACGATICIISGVFDLSAGAVVAAAAITGVLATNALGVAGGFLVAVLVGALLGLVNGLIITGIGVHSFIATLATGIVFRGGAVFLTAGAIAYPAAEPADMLRILSFRVQPFGITLATVLFLVVFVLTWILLSRTTFGRRVYAVGGNDVAARLSGISVARTRIAALMISGVCASLAGLILASRAGSAQPAMGTGLELTAIAAAVVGGTSILGGEGAIWRAGAGVIILQLFSNGFNLLGWDTTYQQVLTGCLILLAVSMDQILRRWKS